MAKREVLKIKESDKELEVLRLRQTRLAYEKRVIALQRIKSGKRETRQALADFLGIKKRRLEGWLTTYRREGIADLLAVKPRRKGSSFISPEIEKELEEILNDPKKGFSSYKAAQHWVKEKHGVNIEYTTLRHYLIRQFKTKIKSPRKTHVKKSVEAVASFLKNSRTN